MSEGTPKDLFSGPAGFAEHWEAINTEYHASPGVSNSMLSKFLEDPALFEGLYVTRRFNSQKQTASQKIGTEFHDIVLSPNGFGGGAVVVPDDVLGTGGKKVGKKFKQFCAMNPGRKPLKRSELLGCLLENITNHVGAETVLNYPGRLYEHNFRWTCPITGLLMRSRFDCLSPLCIGDIKTCKSSARKAFLRSILTFGYHRQMAFYRDAAVQMGYDELPCILVACCTSAPYRIQAYQLSEKFMALGKQEYESAKLDLARRLETNDWDDENKQQIIELEPSEYDLKQLQPVIEIEETNYEFDDTELAIYE